RTEVLTTLSGTRSGRTYFVPGTKKTYTASSPGEPPASVTGRLRGSVKTSVEGKGGGLTGKVGTPLPYGKKLEFGTRKMLPRPWLRISFDKSIEAVKQILSRKWF
ncbi:MAG: HK97 gp10 family phage protein, partial [Ignavibacteria bacterium]|nr:HK97 gp10 family phage protein [Ignavibacteria bacterium]